jgi:hypothetical protein
VSRALDGNWRFLARKNKPTTLKRVTTEIWEAIEGNLFEQGVPAMVVGI